DVELAPDEQVGRRGETSGEIRVKCEVRPGLIDWERTALIPTVDGWSEEVTVWHEDAVDNTIRAGFIGQQNGRVLIELPRETASGHWRLWVRADQVVEG